MRTLASIQKVVKITEIPKADKIEVATILGWEVVVKKNELKPGDLCIYIEVDSIVPPWKEFEFLEERKYRVKIIRLRKQISQGIAFPIKELKKHLTDVKIEEGIDLTDILNIKKHDPETKRENSLSNNKPMNPFIKYMMRFNWFRKLFSNKAKDFPSFVPKTDETRIQSMPSKLRDNDGLYYVTEKLDGQSTTFISKKEKLFGFFPYVKKYICGRNRQFDIPKYKNQYNNYVKIYKQFDISKKLDILNGDYAIQGEIIGEGIQKNKYDITGLDFYVFSIYDIKNRSYVNYSDLVKLCWKMNLKHVPFLKQDVKLPETINEIVEISKAKSVVHPKIWQEGNVWRNMNDSHDSFKCINPEFLLGYNE